MKTPSLSSSVPNKTMSNKLYFSVLNKPCINFSVPTTKYPPFLFLHRVCLWRCKVTGIWCQGPVLQDTGETARSGTLVVGNMKQKEIRQTDNLPNKETAWNKSINIKDLYNCVHTTADTNILTDIPTTTHTHTNELTNTFTYIPPPPPHFSTHRRSPFFTCRFLSLSLSHWHQRLPPTHQHSHKHVCTSHTHTDTSVWKKLYIIHTRAVAPTAGVLVILGTRILICYTDIDTVKT